MEIERYEYPKIELLLDGVVQVIINNDIELGRVQLKILENNLNGYSIRFNGKITHISNRGVLGEWFSGMYDESQKIYGKLTRARVSKSYSEEDVEIAIKNLKSKIGSPIVKHWDGYIIIANSEIDFESKKNKIIKGDRKGFYTVGDAKNMKL